ncbi:MAG: AsnC family protein [Pseudomonadota bacterium]
MTTYHIEEIKGAFVVTELKPVTLGTFLDSGLAHLFVAALEQEFRPISVAATEADEDVTPGDTTEVWTPEIDRELMQALGDDAALEEIAARIGVSFAECDARLLELLPDPTPSSEDQKGYKRDGPRQVRSEKDLEADFQQALTRIADGELCGDVASDMNLPFGALRARRAAFVKAQKADLAEAPDKVKRKAAVPWSTDLDLQVMDARDNEAALERIAAETGGTVAQCNARVEVLLKQAQREMEG